MLENKSVNKMFNIKLKYGYKSKYFSIEELVHPDILNDFGEAKCWQLFDPGLLLMADTLRGDMAVPLTCNDWHKGGSVRYRGARPSIHPPSFKYKPTSMHVFFKALDLVSPKVSAEKMRRHILKNQYRYRYITRLEDNVSWLHMDCANILDQTIKLFNPWK